jgi:hypothetical protein
MNSLGGSKNSINVVFKALDQVSAPVKKIQGQVGAFSRKINATNAAMSVYARKVKTNFAGFAGIGGYITGALATGSIIAFANRSIQAFNRQSQAIKNVEAGLISTKNAAGKTIKELRSMASVLQKKTFFGDEAVLKNVTAQMLTFTNITGKNFDRAQRAALDITAKLYGVEASEESLRSTTIQLAKALNMPTIGMNALSRSGIQFSQAQKKIIKGLVLENKLAKAQAMMLKEVESQYGGTARALAKSSFGRQKQILNEIGDKMEFIGQKLVPIKLTILEIIEKVLSKLPIIFNWIKKHKTLIINITGALAAYKTAQLGATLALLAFGKLSALTNIFNYISAVFSLTKGIRSLSQAQALLNLLWTSNPIGIVITAIGLLAASAFLVIKNWKPIKKFFVDLWASISSSFTKVYDNISNSINRMPLFARGLVRMFFDLITLPVIIIKNWTKITNFFKKLWENIKNIFKNAIDSFRNMIPDWLKNFIGIKNIAVSLDNKIAKNMSKPVGQSALSQINPLSIFGFTKPKFEKEMKATGKNMETVKTVKNIINTTKNSEITENSMMKQNSEITVRFENAPKGTKVDSRKAKKGVDWSMGYSGAF